MTETQSEKFVIGVDFGTTFTGFAFYHLGTGAENNDELSAQRIGENTRVIREWPNLTSAYTEKTPTIIAYNRDPPTWGGSVRSHHEPQIDHFKLGLEPSVVRYFGFDPSDNWLGFGKHPQIPNKDPVDFSTDFLSCVHKWVRESYLPSKFSETFFSTQEFTYIVTVPAIWSDTAKDLTRQAASQAFNIPNDKLTLVTEPEAAALYCATMCREVGLSDGDQFIVCDAGGGTVVSDSLS